VSTSGTDLAGDAAAVSAGTEPVAHGPARPAGRAGLIASTSAMAVLTLGATVALVRIGNPFTAEPEATPALAAAASTPQPSSGTPAADASSATPIAPTPPAASVVAQPAPAPSGALRPSPTPLRATSTPARTLYTVRASDSLSSVARAHGVTVARLAAANGLPADAGLRVGQQLVIPAP
jgi:LysM repeat protein